MRPELKELLVSGAERFSLRLSEKAVAQLARYLELILEYNQKLNLTGIETEEGIVIKHFLDSLSAYQFLKNNWFIADFGSGMGCPGIPLKIVRPSLKLILLESHQKKSAFLNLVVRNLNLENTRAIAQRAEDKNFQMNFRGQLDAVLARAFGKLDLILKLSEPYLKTGGRVIVYKGPQIEPELKSAEKFLAHSQFQQERIFDYELPREMGSRKLLVFKKQV